MASRTMAIVLHPITDVSAWHLRVIHTPCIGYPEVNEHRSGYALCSGYSGQTAQAQTDVKVKNVVDYADALLQCGNRTRNFILSLM